MWNLCKNVHTWGKMDIYRRVAWQPNHVFSISSITMCILVIFSEVKKIARSFYSFTTRMKSPSYLVQQPSHHHHDNIVLKVYCVLSLSLRARIPEPSHDGMWELYDGKLSWAIPNWRLGKELLTWLANQN